MSSLGKPRLLGAAFVSAFLLSQLAAQNPPAVPPVPPPPPSLLGFALTGSTTLGSQYIFRGLTQTDGKPIVQTELDLVHPSGFYLSTSLSNISWFTDQNLGTASAPVPVGSGSSAGVEVDVFGGYKLGFAKDWTLDLGIYRYLYPGSFDRLVVYKNPATTEASLGLSYRWASLKASRVLSGAAFGVASAGGTTYLDLSLAVPLGETGWTLLAHGGRTSFASGSGADNSPLDYTDLRLGVATELKGCTLTLAATYADTRDLASDHQTPLYANAMGRNIGKSRLTFTLAKNF
jgi:uncharacterized protein (TIGR02001 family)